MLEFIFTSSALIVILKLKNLYLIKTSFRQTGQSLKRLVDFFFLQQNENFNFIYKGSNEKFTYASLFEQ